MSDPFSLTIPRSKSKSFYQQPTEVSMLLSAADTNMDQSVVHSSGIITSDGIEFGRYVMPVLATISAAVTLFMSINKFRRLINNSYTSNTTGVFGKKTQHVNHRSLMTIPSSDPYDTLYSEGTEDLMDNEQKKEDTLHDQNAAPVTDKGEVRKRKSREMETKYEKLKEIGRGAFGVVYVGRHVTTGEMVAIKEMPLAVAAELRVEYDLLASLKHNNVVEIKGFEIVKDYARLYLEWVAGGSLADILVYENIRDERLLSSYTRQIIMGLQFLHDNGIIHRDIKPKNILIDHVGTLKLTDFGLSRHMDSMHSQTRCCGTAIYMSPECLDGRFSVGSDIWAVGATVTEMLTGKLPWSHIENHIFKNQFSLMLHIAKYKGTPGHHPVYPRDVSPDCRDFLDICFAPNPEDRGSCEALLRHPFLVIDTQTTTNTPSTTNTFDSNSRLPTSSADILPDTTHIVGPNQCTNNLD